MNNFLTVKQINKIFQPDKDVKVLALRDINLDIERGGFVVLSGPSGSGKTTTLYAALTAINKLKSSTFPQRVFLSTRAVMT